jgi:Uma2 family endonuclease
VRGQPVPRAMTGATQRHDMVVVNALVLEVLSPSTSEIDRLEKLEEFKTIPSIEYILIAEPGAARVLLYARTEGRGWTSLSYIGLDSVLPLPALARTLPLSELYEGVVPLSRPAP